MMCPHFKESAQNLEFLQTQISDLRKVLITVLERFSFMRQILDQRPQNILIQDLISSAMKEEKLTKET